MPRRHCGRALVIALWAALTAWPGEAAIPPGAGPTGFYWPTGVPLAKDGPETINGRQMAGWLTGWPQGSYALPNGAPGYHLAKDIPAMLGTAVVAVADGQILRISDGAWGAGNVAVVVQHHTADGTPFRVVYGHVRLRAMEPADQRTPFGPEVKAGIPFAVVGPFPNEGNAMPHLHLVVVPGTGLLSNGQFGTAPLLPNPGKNADLHGAERPVTWLTTHDAPGMGGAEPPAGPPSLSEIGPALEGAAPLASPDGRFLATRLGAVMGEQTQVYDQGSGQVRWTVAGWPLAIRPDSSMIAVGTGSVLRGFITELRALADGTLVITTPGNLATFSPNGRLVATTDDLKLGKQSTYVLDLPTKRRRQVAGGSPRFSPDGTVLLTVEGGTTRRWSLAAE